METFVFIDRLLEFIPMEPFEWDKSKPISISDIRCALKKIPEISEPYGDTNMYQPTAKSRKWHIGRIIYFINHKNEIADIEIDNSCYDGMIMPSPFIVDGWHRLAAAYYLYTQGEMDCISCRYGGRLDVLEYLKHETNELSLEMI